MSHPRTKQRSRGISDNISGHVSLEYALILIPFLYLLFGVIQFSVIMLGQSILQSATLAAAREGATGCTSNPSGQNGTTGCIATTLQNHLYGMFNMSNVYVCTLNYGSSLGASDTLPGACTATSEVVQNANDIVTYRVSYNWPVILPLLSKIIGNGDGTYTLNATAFVENEPY